MNNLINNDKGGDRKMNTTSFKELRALIQFFDAHGFDSERIPMLLIVIESEGLAPVVDADVEGIENILFSGLVNDLETLGILRRMVYDLQECLFHVFERKLDSELIEIVTRVKKSISLFGFSKYFEYLIAYLNHPNRISKSYTGTSELYKFLANIFEIRKDSIVYNPFSRMGSITYSLPADCIVYSQERNMKLWQFGLLRLLVNKNPNFLYTHCGDVVEEFLPWPHLKGNLDIVLCDPPFGNKTIRVQDTPFNNHIELSISKGLEALNDNGKMAVVCHAGFLTSQSRRTKELRKRIVDNGVLSAVILMPKGIYLGAGIATAVLLFDKSKKQKEVIMFDASDFFSEKVGYDVRLKDAQLLKALKGDHSNKQYVSRQSIRESKYDLIPGRYFLTKFKGQPLSNLVEIIRGRRIDHEQKVLKLSVKDLNNFSWKRYIEINALQIDILSKGDTLIDTDCLLVSRIGANISAALFNYTNQAIAIPPHITAIKSIDKSKLLNQYLQMLFERTEIIEQINLLQRGTIIEQITPNDLLSVKVVVPPIDEQISQISAVEGAQKAILEKQKALIAEMKEVLIRQKEDLSIKKHNISQHLGNVMNSIAILENAINENGVLKPDDVLSKKYGTTVEMRIDLMKVSLQKAMSLAENITNEIGFEPKKEYDLNKLVSDAIKSNHNSNLYEIDFDHEYSEKLELVPTVECSKKDFDIIFRNIIENAEKHGFVDGTSGNIIKVRHYYSDDYSKLILSIANNGKPFPEGMTERYHIKGEKGGETGNTGLGSWLVYETMKYFNGSVEVVNNPSLEFPVAIKLIFPSIEPGMYYMNEEFLKVFNPK